MELQPRGIASVTNLFREVSDVGVYYNIGGGVNGARDWNTYTHWHCYVEGLTVTKGELIKFLEPFMDEIEIKVKGEGFKLVYTFNRDTGVGELALILD